MKTFITGPKGLQIGITESYPVINPYLLAHSVGGQVLLIGINVDPELGALPSQDKDDWCR